MSMSIPGVSHHGAHAHGAKGGSTAGSFFAVEGDAADANDAASASGSTSALPALSNSMIALLNSLQGSLPAGSGPSTTIPTAAPGGSAAASASTPEAAPDRLAAQFGASGSDAATAGTAGALQSSGWQAAADLLPGSGSVPSGASGSDASSSGQTATAGQTAATSDMQQMMKALQSYAANAGTLLSSSAPLLTI